MALRRRLRATVLKQWKRAAHRPAIDESGCTSSSGPRRYTRPQSHWWALSERRAVNRGLTNEFFERRGLVSLHAPWRQHHDRIWNIGPIRGTAEVRKSMPNYSHHRPGKAARYVRAWSPRERRHPEEPDVRPTSPVL